MAMSATSVSTLVISLLFGLLLSCLDTAVAGAQIGVCYGVLGDNLPTRREVVDMFNQYGIQRMRIYYADKEALEALRGSNIELLMDVANEDIEKLAGSQAEANAWVQNNVIKYSNVKIKNIAVGNEIHPSMREAHFLVPAMQNIQNAVSAAGLGNKIKVSTAIDMGSFQDSYPPSKCSFSSEYRAISDHLIPFLVNKGSPLLVNMYPYFSYQGEPQHISLDFALFRSQTVVVHDPPHGYKSLFIAMLDAVYSALEKAGGGAVEVFVSETGWPTRGGLDTTVENARVYNNNLIQRVKSGTPKRPGKPVETYIFSMFNENLKNGPETERFWGLFFPNKTAKYPVNFN